MQFADVKDCRKHKLLMADRGIDAKIVTRTKPKRTIE